MKRCKACRIEKPFSEFYRRGGVYRQTATAEVFKFVSKCKSCTIDEARWAQMKLKYGLTRGQFMDLLAEQGGVCAICQEAEILEAYLTVDHCHDTGEVRGLLCRACNGGLGLFRDDPSRLEAALEYLRSEKHRRQFKEAGLA